MTVSIRNFPVPYEDRTAFLTNPDAHRISASAWLNGRNLTPEEIHDLLLRGSAITLREADALTRATGSDEFFKEWATLRGMGDLEPPVPFVTPGIIHPGVKPSYLALASILPRNDIVTPKAISDRLSKGKGFVSDKTVASLETPEPIIDIDLILSLRSVLGWVERGLVENICDIRGYADPMLRAIDILADSEMIVAGKPLADQLAALVSPLAPMEIDASAFRRWAIGKGLMDTFLATCLNTALKLPFGTFPGSVPRGEIPSGQWTKPQRMRKAVIEDFAYLMPPIRQTLAADLSFSPEEVWITLLGGVDRAEAIYKNRGGFNFNDLVQISRAIGKPPVWAALALSPKQKRSKSELVYLERFLTHFASGLGADIEAPKEYLLRLCFGADWDDFNETLALQVVFGKAQLNAGTGQKLERWIGVPYGRIIESELQASTKKRNISVSRKNVDVAETIIGDDGEVVTLSPTAKNIVRFTTYALQKARIALTDDIIADFSTFLRVKSGMPFTTHIVRSWLEETAPIALAEMQLICALFTCTPKQLMGDERGETYVFKKESVEVCKGRLMNKYATLLNLKQHSKGIPFFTYTGQDNESFLSRLQLAFFASENAVSAGIKPGVMAKKLQYLCGPLIRVDADWVMGHGLPDEETIIRIANVLHIDAGWLAGKQPEIGFYRDAMRRSN